jgi:hypothetical protein
VAFGISFVAATGAIGAPLPFKEPNSSPEAAGDNPNAITAADFDGDGDRDLAVANYASNDVTILRNDGSGNFKETSQSPLLAGFRPYAITSADLDGDADNDLAVVNTSSGNVTILRNGGGKFKQPDTSPEAVGSIPTAIAAADFDGDIDRDLAVANQGSDNVTILRNNLGLDFTVASTVQAGDGPSAIAAADLDGDGDADLAVANWFAPTLTILLNSGGTFVQPPTSPEAIGNGAYGIAAADLDGDGDIDLAVANGLSHNVTILRNDLGGNFTQPSSSPIAVGTTPTSVTAADFDGDGDNDLAVANFGSDNVTLLRNNGAGKFTEPNSSPELAGDGARSIVAGDLEPDGDSDLAIANSNSDNVTILKNRSAAPAASQPRLP